MAVENDAFIHCKERAGVRKMKWPVIVSGSQHLQPLHVELISTEKKFAIHPKQKSKGKVDCRNNIIALSSDRMEIKMKALFYMVGIQAVFVGDEFRFPLCTYSISRYE